MSRPSLTAGVLRGLSWALTAIEQEHESDPKRYDSKELKDVAAARRWWHAQCEKEGLGEGLAGPMIWDYPIEIWLLVAVAILAIVTLGLFWQNRSRP